MDTLELERLRARVRELEDCLRWLHDESADEPRGAGDPTPILLAIARELARRLLLPLSTEYTVERLGRLAQCTLQEGHAGACVSAAAPAGAIVDERHRCLKGALSLALRNVAPAPLALVTRQRAALEAAQRLVRLAMPAMGECVAFCDAADNFDAALAALRIDQPEEQ